MPSILEAGLPPPRLPLSSVLVRLSSELRSDALVSLPRNRLPGRMGDESLELVPPLLESLLQVNVTLEFRGRL